MFHTRERNLKWAISSCGKLFLLNSTPMPATSLSKPLFYVLTEVPNRLCLVIVLNLKKTFNQNRY